MTLNEAFPLRFLINLGRRNDRRGEVEWQLLQAGIEAERFPAVDARFVKSTRGYWNKGRYALALTQRLAVRAARQRGAEAVLLLEDDVLFHPNIHELFDRIELPDDWGMLYLGCSHEGDLEIISPGLVKTTQAIDTHAVAIHSRAYDEVIRVLDLMPEVRAGNDPRTASDRVLARLHGKIPTYACFPNLVWQALVQSDLRDEKLSLYTKSGTHKASRSQSQSLFSKMVTGQKNQLPPKLALLFLTRGDVNQPKIWREFVKQSPSSVSVYSHPKNPEELEGGFLEGTAIKEHHETAWGNVSLVRASISLLQAALEDETNTHFVLLSESCVPVRPLNQILQRLKYDPRPQFKPLPWDRSPLRFRLKANAMTTIPKQFWRVHFQWWLFDRACAVLTTQKDYTTLVEDMFAPDEGYFGTVLNFEGYPLEDFLINEECTWTHWQENAGSPDSHEKITYELLAEIVSGPYLFARKFPPNADIGRHRLHLPLDLALGPTMS